MKIKGKLYERENLSFYARKIWCGSVIPIYLFSGTGIDDYQQLFEKSDAESGRLCTSDSGYFPDAVKKSQCKICGKSEISAADCKIPLLAGSAEKALAGEKVSSYLYLSKM